MKFTKLSLIAALAVTTAMAGEGKISGDAKLFYGTTDIGTTGGHDNSLFNKYGATGDAAVSLDYSREIASGVTANVGVTGISTLGLEHTLVAGTWVPHGGTSGLDDTVWIDTANLVLKPLDKTMLVVGRQELDTPLAFTEKWNIAYNTFDAAVMVDNHLEKTTLVAAWVGRGNGHNGFQNVDGGQSLYGALNGAQDGGLSTANGSATPYMNNGAYAAAAVTKLIPMTTAQVWYYNVQNQANAIWAQADIAPMDELTIGAQYSVIQPKGAVVSALPDNSADTSAMAFKLGYNVAGINLYGAYSKVSDDGLVYMGNTATGGAHGGQSKLYTEAYWNYNMVGQNGAQTVAVGAGYDMGAMNLTAQYTTVTNDIKTENQMDEITLTASTKVGAIDVTAAFINTASDNTNLEGNTVQAYLTVPFSL